MVDPIVMVSERKSICSGPPRPSSQYSGGLSAPEGQRAGKKRQEIVEEGEEEEKGGHGAGSRGTKDCLFWTERRQTWYIGKCRFIKGESRVRTRCLNFIRHVN